MHFLSFSEPFETLRERLQFYYFKVLPCCHKPHGATWQLTQAEQVSQTPMVLGDDSIIAQQSLPLTALQPAATYHVHMLYSCTDYFSMRNTLQ